MHSREIFNSILNSYKVIATIEYRTLHSPSLCEWLCLYQYICVCAAHLFRGHPFISRSFDTGVLTLDEVWGLFYVFLLHCSFSNLLSRIHPLISQFLRFKDIAQRSKDDLVALGFPQFTIEDFHDTVRCSSVFFLVKAMAIKLNYSRTIMLYIYDDLSIKY